MTSHDDTQPEGANQPGAGQPLSWQPAPQPPGDATFPAPGAAPLFQPGAAPQPAPVPQYVPDAAVAGGAVAFSADAGQPRSRKPLMIGIAAALVLVLAVGGTLLWLNVFSKLGGAGSPEAAVTQLVEGAVGKDAIAVYGVLSPADLGLFPDVRESTRSAVDENVSEDVRKKVETAWESVKIDLDGLTTEVEEIDEGIAKVYLTEGTVSLDYDVEAVTNAADAIMFDIEYPMDALEMSGLGGSGETDPAMREEMREEMRKGLTVPAEDRTWDLTEARFETAGGTERSAPFVVAVEEGGTWYVSPVLTIAEYALATVPDIKRGSMPDAAGQQGYDSPDAVLAAFPDVLDDVLRGNPDSLEAMLPLAERRLLALYISPHMTAGGAGVSGVTLDPVEFQVLSQDGDRAVVGIKNLGITPEGMEGESLRLHDVSCYEFESASTESHGGCLTEIPLLGRLGVGELGFVAVKESTGWHLSALGSLTHLGQTFGDRIAALEKDGVKIDELTCDHELLQVPSDSRAIWSELAQACEPGQEPFGLPRLFGPGLGMFDPLPVEPVEPLEPVEPTDPVDTAAEDALTEAEITLVAEAVQGWFETSQECPALEPTTTEYVLAGEAVGPRSESVEVWLTCVTPEDWTLTAMNWSSVEATMYMYSSREGLSELG